MKFCSLCRIRIIGSTFPSCGEGKHKDLCNECYGRRQKRESWLEPVLFPDVVDAMWRWEEVKRQL